jgi:hypothetical protein
MPRMALVCVGSLFIVQSITNVKTMLSDRSMTSATEWERQFVLKEQDLTIMSTETHQLITSMTQLVIDIQGAVRFQRNCGTA